MQKRDHCSFRHKASWMDFNTFKLMHLHFILSAIWFYFMYECRHPAISMFNRIPRIAACLLQADLHRKFPTSQWQIQGIFHIRKLCVNVRRFETLGWLWRPQDSVQVISASPSFRRFLQRPKKTSHIDLMEFLDWMDLLKLKLLVSVPLFLLCLAPDHRRQGETRFRGMSRQLQPEEHPPASGLHKAGPFKKTSVLRAHPQKKHKTSSYYIYIIIQVM